MRNMGKIALFSGLALAAIGLTKTANADAWNKKTIMTISEPIQVPKKVLEPGTYVLKLLDSLSDRHIVQIFNEKENHLITTILAIPNYRLQPTGKTQFDFWEAPAGQPRALRAWFYPGDNFGQEFAYSPSMSAQITAFNKTSVPVTYSESETDLKTSKVESSTVTEAYVAEPPAETKVETTVEVTPAPAPEPVVVAAAPAPEPQAPEPAPTIVENRVQADLPQTASDYPLIALVGFLSLAAFAGLTLRMKSAR